MNDYHASEIRNFAIVGHGGSGKTMLAECMLASSGVINRLGSVANGTTVSDYHEDEKHREISIHASILHTEWMERKFNIVDTPGYLDFISDGLGALRVGDFALVVVDAAKGIELGTLQTCKYADEYNIPKVFVINGMDRENADFDGVLASLREQFGPRVFPLSLPINPGSGFNQVLDVMRSEEIDYQTDGSGAYTETKAAGQWNDKVKSLHKDLIETIAESGDDLMETFFEQDGLTEEQLRSGVHRAFQEGLLIPCFATSAEHNAGVARLMDFIAKYGSSPTDRKTVEGMDEDGKAVRVTLDGEDPVLYVFKTISEPHVGDLSFFRIYSGTIRVGMELHNSDRDKMERVGQIYLMNGRQRETVDHLYSGDIGAFVKLKDTHTGNTLCKPGLNIRLPKVSFPQPNIHGALVVPERGDEERLSAGLTTLHEEDPTFLFGVNEETGETVLSGQGELHLQIILDGLKERFNVDVELREPKVPFRETIRGNGEARYRHKKQSGGAGQFAEVWMRIEPNERDAGIDFQESLVGQNVDRVFVPSVEKGVMAACAEGIVAGYRVVDVKIDFYDGKMHPVDSKDVAFQIAGKEAFREAFTQAKPALLEPILEVKVFVPEAFLGDVMGDISSRRGRILGVNSEDGLQVVSANVPQVEMYKYSTNLRSMTQGRGYHRESLSHYEFLPPELEQRVARR